ncbi:MAG: autotransporter domain-containing protein [Pyramidobacter sp.]|nr:autotransporter domain-containing protein [Pyramidobacter sp.]
MKINSRLAERPRMGRRRFFALKSLLAACAVLMGAFSAGAQQYAEGSLSSLAAAVSGAIADGSRIVVLSGDLRADGSLPAAEISDAVTILGQGYGVLGTESVSSDQPLVRIVSGGVLSDISFKDANAASKDIRGSALSVGTSGELILSGDVCFQGTKAQSGTLSSGFSRGGAVYSEGHIQTNVSGICRVLSLTTDTTSAVSRGAAQGGAFWQSGDLTLSAQRGISMSSSEATALLDASGGAVWASGPVSLRSDLGSVSISGTKAVSSGSGRVYGGAVYAQRDILLSSREKLTLADSEARSASGEAYGGSLYSRGAVKIESSSDVELTWLNAAAAKTVQGGAVWASGDIAIESGGALSLVSIGTASTGKTYASGGALYSKYGDIALTSESDAIFSQLTVSSGGNASGGTLHSAAGTVSVSSLSGSVVFEGVKADSILGSALGGAVFARKGVELSAERGDIFISDISAESEKMEAQGGAVRSDSEAVLTAGGEVRAENTSAVSRTQASGGVVYARTSLQIEASGGIVFSGNRAESTNGEAFGGALYSLDGSVELKSGGDTVLAGNCASGAGGAQGGAVFAAKDILMSSEGSVIVAENAAQSQVSSAGGALYAGGGVNIAASGDVVFKNNSVLGADAVGAAIYAALGDIRVTAQDILFENNKASGGTICAQKGAVLMSVPYMASETNGSAIKCSGEGQSIRALSAVSIDSGVLDAGSAAFLVSSGDFYMSPGRTALIASAGTADSDDLFLVEAQSLIIGAGLADSVPLALRGGSAGVRSDFMLVGGDAADSLTDDVLAAFDISGYRGGKITSRDLGGARAALSLHYDGRVLDWTGGAGAGVWRSGSGGWSLSSLRRLEQEFAESDDVIFDASQSDFGTAAHVDIQGTVLPHSVSVRVASSDLGGTLTFGGSGNIASGSLHKSGDGSLDIWTVNGYGGGTFIESGSVIARSAGALGTGSVAVSNGASLVLDVEQDGVLSNGAGSLSGKGNLIKRGSGTLDLSSQSLGGSLLVLGGTAKFANLSMAEGTCAEAAGESSALVADVLNAAGTDLFLSDGARLSAGGGAVGAVAVSENAVVSGRLSARSLSGGFAELDCLDLTLDGVSSLRGVTIPAEASVSGGALSVGALTGGRLTLNSTVLTLDGSGALESLHGAGHLTLQGGASLALTGSSRRNCAESLTLESGSVLYVSQGSGFDGLKRFFAAPDSRVEADVSGDGAAPLFTGENASAILSGGAKLSLNGVRLNGVYTLLDGFNGSFSVAENGWFSGDLALDALDVNSPLLEAKVHAKDSVRGLYQIRVVSALKPGEIPHITLSEAQTVQRLIEHGLNQSSSAAGERFLSNVLDDAKVPLDQTAAHMQSVMDPIGTAATAGTSLRAASILTNAVSSRLQERELFRSARGRAPSAERRSNGVWGSSWYVNSLVSGLPAGRLAQDSRTLAWGVTFGSDYTRRNNRLTSGIAFHAGRFSTEGRGIWIQNSSDGDFAGALLYAGHTGRLWTLAADAGYIWVQSDAEVLLPQTLDCGAFAEAKGVKGSVFTAGLRADWNVSPRAVVRVRPFASVRWNYYRQDGHSVSSAAGVLSVNDSDSMSQWQFPIGVAIDWQNIAAGGWNIMPSLELAYVRTAGDRNVASRSRIPGAPWLGATEFVTSVADRDSFRVRLRCEARKIDCVLGLELGAQLSDHQDDVHAAASLRLDL